MPSKPLACPNCRTWFEGSGHSVRCPSCGRRFNADAAALDKPSRPKHEDLPSAGWSIEPESVAWDRDSGALQETFEGQTETGESAPEDKPPSPEPSVQESNRPNLGIIFTIGFLAFLFVGPRFLDGASFVIVLGVLMAARWLYGRWSRGQAQASGP